MRRVFKKLSCLVLTFILMSSFMCANATSVRSSNYLNAYRASLTADSNGTIWVSATVIGRESYSKIGLSQIKIYESSNGGKTFSHFASYSSDDYPSMMGSGIRYSQDALAFTGTVGNQYKAIVYVYAGDSSGYDEKAYTTSTVTAIR